jgi:DNA repair protein RAD5
LEPWSDYQWWNTYINKPYEKGITTVFEMLQQIINPILLRRTKKSKTKDGNYIISLPNKEM